MAIPSGRRQPEVRISGEALERQRRWAPRNRQVPRRHPRRVRPRRTYHDEPFSPQAIEASYRRGAITILLLDGAAIVELMVAGRIGVSRQPVYLHEVDPTFFNFDDL